MPRGKTDSAFVGAPLNGRRAKVADEIIETLRREIVSRRLTAGQRLPTERQLAEQFNVSQPTIREAIRALDVMGLVEARHGSGVYVRGDSAFLVATALHTLLQMERVSIIEALDVREVLGRETARIAAAHADEDDLAELERRLARMDDLGEESVEGVLDAIAAFQQSVAAATHNPLLHAVEAFLINLLLQIQIKALRKRGANYWRERSAGFQGDRTRLVEAIRNRDGDRASAAMEGYLEHQRRVFLADPEFAKMRLSDAKAVRAVAEMASIGRRRLDHEQG